MDKKLKLKKEIYKISKKNGLNLNNLKKFDSIQIAELMITLEQYYRVKLNYEDLTDIKKIIKKISN